MGAMALTTLGGCGADVAKPLSRAVAEMPSRLQLRQFLVAFLSAAGLVGALYYVLRGPDPDEEPAKQQRSGKATNGKVRNDAEKLDLDSLDPEERKLLAEVSKKGYYHGRPKSETTTSTPQRIDSPEKALDQGKRRTDFDDFQKKWDRFGD